TARAASDPLVIAGGPAIFLNPEPIADFVDCFLIGEAEEMLPEFMALLRRLLAGQDDRGAQLDAVAAQVAGAYVPARFEPCFDGAVTAELRHRGAAQVERR